jgi:hypothetical protein
MRFLQLPILALVLIVATFAIAFTALKTASELWYDAFYTFTAVVLLAAVFAARFRRRNEKAFWFGFAVFGWAFLVLGLGPWPNFDGDDDGVAIAVNKHVLTSRVILFLVPYLRAKTDDLAHIDKITTYTIGVAHLLTTLAIATAGGILAIVIRERRGRLVSVKSLLILAGLAVSAAAASSITSGRPARPWLPRSSFRYLASLKSLAQQNPRATAYGLAWMPTFHHPVAVRIDWTAGGAELRAEVLDGKGGYVGGQIAIDKKITLSADQIAELSRQVEKAGFWAMPTAEDLGKDPYSFVTDGDRLTIHGVKQGAYHLVTRVLPDPSFTKLCRHILELTGLKFQESWAGYHDNDDQPEM